MHRQPVSACGPRAQEVAHFAAECEKYVGTQSGGMDQAISIMGQAGVAKLISFNPVRWGLCWNLGPWIRPSPSWARPAPPSSSPSTRLRNGVMSTGLGCHGSEQRSSKAAVLGACKRHVPILQSVHRHRLFMLLQHP